MVRYSSICGPLGILDSFILDSCVCSFSVPVKDFRMQLSSREIPCPVYQELVSPVLIDLLTIVFSSSSSV